MVSTRRNASAKNRSKQGICIETRARSERISESFTSAEFIRNSEHCEKTSILKTSCGYRSWLSSSKACKSCGFPLAMSVSRFALWTAARKVDLESVSFMAAVLNSVFVYMTLLFFHPCFFKISCSPMLPLPSSNNFSVIDPDFWHPSGWGNWTFPENYHQRSMGSSTTPYVSFFAVNAITHAASWCSVWW